MATTTDKTPIRVTAEHYQMESSRKGKEGTFYNLVYNNTTKRWECDCPDAAPQAHNISYKIGNPNCKHVRRLREYIAEQKALQAGEQPVLAAAQAIADVAQDTSLRDEIEVLRQELSEACSKIFDLQMIAEDSLNRRAVMLQQIDHLEFSDRVKSNKIDQLRADLALETELRQNQTRIWLETSTKQHEQERALIAAVNTHAEMIAAQAAEIERLKNDRKLDIEISVKSPRTRPNTKPAARKAKTSQQAEPEQQPAMEIKKVREGLHLVGDCKVFGAQFAMACECERSQSGNICEHMTALNKFLGVK